MHKDTRSKWTFGMDRDRWLACHRQKLLDQGDLYLSLPGEGTYRLTIQGEEKVLYAMLPFTSEPGLMLLIEQWYAERFDIPGPLSSRALNWPVT